MGLAKVLVLLQISWTGDATVPDLDRRDYSSYTSWADPGWMYSEVSVEANENVMGFRRGCVRAMSRN